MPNNRLSNARSPYLRKAAMQPVNWFEWCDEAFEEAKRRDCPILLSIGGVWCHWCHVMAHESFEVPETAELINEHYVAIKVDRDERPDIDRRYQDAVIHISGAGGWPLTAFLTPEGKIFFGGTYFPPEARWQKPGFRALLLRLAELYHKDRQRIEEAADGLYGSTVINASMTAKSVAGENMIKQGVSAILSMIDTIFGGLGKAPKFHHASAFQFLINYNFFEKNVEIDQATTATLDSMAKGGVYDHLLGGFFRYSTDERWLIPHFEKMLYDNAELLKLYSIGYRLFGKELYRHAAAGIVEYYKKYGSDERGGFFASQDADIGVLDEGGYYAFSSDELSGILTSDEYEAARVHFGIGTVGALHHDPSKHVLFLDKEPEQIAAMKGWSVTDVVRSIGSAKEKMLAYREGSREMPYIDKTTYTNWNGLMIEGLCVAGNIFDTDEYVHMAEKAASRVLDDYYADGRIMHMEGVEGFSEDYIFFTGGLLELFQSTQKQEYIRIAKALINEAISLFWDPENWGFFDAKPGGHGYLSIGLKNIQDTPVRSANGIAPLVLMQLADATGDDEYRHYADMTLQAFAALMDEYPTMSYSYLMGLHAHYNGSYKVETSEFFERALNDFRPYKIVMRKDITGVLICEKNTCRKYDSYPQGG
ncbi:MAG TPA: thioredoxin domain-containing protein [Dissulfurispiraceae bacterium]|nr:thioredoxin domain-containing protein [Dissulfurispiraceae bacterium]